MGRGRGQIIRYSCTQPGHLARDCQNPCMTCIYCNSFEHVIKCWVCVIFFARVVVSERLHQARSPPRGGSGAAPPKFFFLSRHIFAGLTYF
jgi:hypothetical protein